MKKITLFVLIVFAIPNLVLPQDFNIAHLYPVESIHSYFEFETTYMGYAKVKGNFSEFYGSVYYNPEDVSKTSVSLQIEVESIDTNNDWRDSDLKSGNWFLAEKFPYITFTSSKVEKEANGLKVYGNLTIKETTKAISFSIAPAIGVIEDIRGDHQVIFTGSYTLNRKDYGVMGKNWSQVKEGIAALSDDVTISFSLLGKQIKEENFQNFLRNEKRPPGAIYAAYNENGVEGAIKRFEALKQETALNANAMNMAAYMLIQQDKLTDALSLIEKNHQAFPNEADIYNLHAGVFARMNNLEKAKEYYERSLELDPKNMNAAEALKHLK